MRKIQFKWVLMLCLTAGMMVSAVSIFYIWTISTFLNTPFDPAAENIHFTIAQGQHLSDISTQLEQRSIIANSTYFNYYARFKNADKKLQAGDYVISAADTPKQILNTFLTGRVALSRMTVPEGWDIRQISELLADFVSCSQNEFIALCRDPAYVKSFGIPSDSLEGYLFPDTYFFPGDASCKTIISTMVNHFHTVFTPDMDAQADALGFTRHEIVILASIIEKETGDPDERPLIASVFHNRLEKKMRLESDPTVIYGIPDFDGNIKRIHLRTPTPYNTYQINGFPAGPIANPGRHAILAALYPAQSDYLFFVSKKDSTHHFSRTYPEHHQAVRKYQLGK